MGNLGSSARTKIRHWQQRSPLSKRRENAHQKWNIAGQSTATTSSKATTVDWKRILGPKSGFKTPTSAYRALQGMEAMHSLRKGQGRLFAYGAPSPDAVIVTKAFQHL